MLNLPQGLDGRFSPPISVLSWLTVFEAQNTENLESYKPKSSNTHLNTETTECSLSKVQLDLEPAKEILAQLSILATSRLLTDSLKIFNNKHKKVYFTIELIPTPNLESHSPLKSGLFLGFAFS